MGKIKLALRGLLLIAIVGLLAPWIASAQTGTIAGIVKDSSGSIIPNVTVTASSPALLDQSRITTTDGEGNYRLVELAVGTYSVGFAAAGFQSFKQEGIDLTGGVTVTVNADMRIGAQEQTITVTSEVPQVDIQNSTEHTSLETSQVEELPTGRAVGQYGVLIPGVTTNEQDVGGTWLSSSTPNEMAIHGSDARETPMIISGMSFGNMFGTGGGVSGPYLVNAGMVQEMAVDTSGGTAEASVGGFRQNVILKSGSNDLHGFVFAGGFPQSLEASNLNAKLRSEGAVTPSIVEKSYDFNMGLGGAIKKDKVWFYVSYRNYGSDQQPTGAYSAANPTAVVYTPPTVVNGQITNYNSASPSLPVNAIRDRNYNVRFDIKTSKNSTLTMYADQMPRCVCANGLGSTGTLQATTHYHNPVNGIEMFTWNWVATPKLLIEAGEIFKPDEWGFDFHSNLGSNIASVMDVGTGIASRAPTGLAGQFDQHSFQHNGKFVATYVTGSSSLKVGSQWFQGSRVNRLGAADDLELELNNGVPLGLIEYAGPIGSHENMKLNLGLFAQEQYKFHRLTINAGARFDYLNEYIPAQIEPAVPKYLLAGPSYPQINNVPDWKDISPRFGLVYDVFGNGKTALKWSLGRFVEAEAGGFPQEINPSRSYGNVFNFRSWTNDPAGLATGVPSCDLTNPAANGACGPSTNPNFGSGATSAYSFDPKVATGWGTRGYNWEMLAGIQHQLLPGLAIDVSYNHRWFGNFRVGLAQNVTPSDYTSYCVTSPVDSRLPGGGGQQICGFYEPTSAAFYRQAQSNILITRANGVSEVYDGVDVAVTLRLARGIVAQGGTSTGRENSNWCGAVVGHPNAVNYSEYTSFGSFDTTWPTFAYAAPYCKATPPFLTQVKGSVVYPTVWHLVASATFQSMLYPQEFSGGYGGVLAGYSVPYADTTLPGTLGGTTFSNGAASQTVQLLADDSKYGDRLYQLDFRIGRKFSIHDKYTLEPQFNLFNSLNNNAVITQNNTYGSHWQQPISIVQARVAQFSLSANF
jgi:hypothetical protein